MKLKLTNKKRAIQIGAFGVILVFVLGLVLNSNFLQAKADMVNVNVDDTIKILEVGPGNLSRLADGIGTYKKTANGKNYTVTYMSMPEYISGIDDIAGKYDIVAITNKNDNLADKFTDENVLDTKYTKYSTEFSSEMSNLKYSKNNDDENDNGYASSGSSLENKYSGTTKTYVEFYSENDITNKRAEEILDMAKRGQVVYVENSALIDGSKLKQNFDKNLNAEASNVKNVEEVKISDLLSEYKNSSKRPEIANFKVSSDDSNLTVGHKSTRNLKFAFDYKDAPDNFVVKVYVDYNADGMFKEYQSGAGYRNELLVTKTLSKKAIGNTYEIESSIYSSFIGYLDWKVEVYAGDDTNTKTSIISNFKFKKLTEDKSGAAKLKVLQVYPDKVNNFNENGTFAGKGDYENVGGLVLSNKLSEEKLREKLEGYNDGTQGVFNNEDGTITIKQKSDKDKLYIAGTFNDWTKQEMSKNTDGIYEITLELSKVGGGEYKIVEEPNNWYSNSGNTHKGTDNNSYIYTEDVNEQSRKFQEFLNAVKDYSVTVDSVSVTEFNENCNDASTNMQMQDYDMIIIGFGDSYGGEYDFNEKAVDVIQKYIDSKAIMLSHDTMTLSINRSVTSKSNGTEAKGNTRFTNMLKETVGQSRYDNDNIPSGNKSLGQTLYAIRNNSHGVTRDGANFYEQSKTKTVREVSQAQITEYPYNLSDDGISTGTKVDEQNAINISQTHTQWYQLDLENEDISPWFNLVSDGSYKEKDTVLANADQFNSGDARNFYYTYSIGNITYSGTGHTSNYTDSELKLFVNTIIRAARSGKISDLELRASEPEGVSTNKNAPTIINDINSPYSINFNISGTLTETIINNKGTTVTQVPYTGEVVNSYALAVYDINGNSVDINTSTLGSGDTSGFNPLYTIPVSTINMLSENRYTLSITLTSNVSNDSSYDNVIPASCTIYVTAAETLETLEIKHGMIKGDANASGASEIETGCPEVDYYTSIPFEAQISGLKLYTNKTIELTIDKNFVLPEKLISKVSSVSNRTLIELVEPKEKTEETINTEKQDDGTTKITMDLGALPTNEIIVRYAATTMAQPEQTTEVGDDGIKITKGDNVVYANTIKVTSKTSNSASASVQVGRVVLDKPLF